VILDANLIPRTWTHGDLIVYLFIFKSDLNDYSNFVLVPGRPDPVSALCHDCGKTMNSTYALRRHRLIVHGCADATSDDKILSCPYCDRKDLMPSTLKAHILARHEDYRPFKCPECSYRANAIFTLKTHFRMIHKRNIERRFVKVDKEGYPGKPYVIFDKDTGEEIVTVRNLSQK
jgi:DNA-directed RNA polymerase subunit RPC12/RpoP